MEINMQRMLSFHILALLFLLIPGITQAQSTCIAMNNQDPQQCQVCDDALGSYLTLLSPQKTICGYAINATHCKVDSLNYNEISDQLKNMSPQLEFINQTSIGDTQQKGYCINREIYRNDSGEVICSGNKGNISGVTQDLLQQLDIEQLICPVCDNPLYNNEVVIAYPKLNLLFGVCNKTYQGTQGCKFNQYRDDPTKQCKNCSEKFANCFSCDSTKCLVCNPNFQPSFAVLNSLTYHAQCISCKDGYCLDSEQNKCIKSSIQGCRHCNMLNSNSLEETCQQCLQGQYLQNNTCREVEKKNQNFNLFVDSSIIPLLKDQQSQIFEKNFLSQSEKDRGLDFSSPLPSLLFAFKQLSVLGRSLEGFTAVIYLAKGDHFLHSCTNEDTKMFKLDSNTKDYYNLCELFRKVYTTESGKVSVDSNDNYKITIQPLYCELDSKIGLEGNEEFQNRCVDENNQDYQPVINVMNSFAYFNVTGSLEIVDVNFTGVNALSQPRIAQLLPLRLCEIKNQLDTSLDVSRQTVMNVQVPSQQAASSFWQCKDTYYSGSTTPYQNLKNDMRCKESLNSLMNQTTQSTLNCPGTPLHPNYFRTDINDPYLINGYPWRRQALFNIYSVNTESSRKDAYTSPSLIIDKCSFRHFYDGYESLIHVETDNLSRIVRNHLRQANSSLNNVTYITLSGVDLGVSLYITNSQFSFSRFCRGLIYYRKFNPDISPLSFFVNQSTLSMPQTQKVSSPLIQTPKTSQPLIYIYNSNFVMLNSLTNLTALQSLKSAHYQTILPGIRYRIPAHRGIVLNVEDFEGPIELLQNHITHNAHFIPELNFKYQPDEKLGVGLGLSARKKFVYTRNSMEEFRMGACENNKSDVRFMETVLRQSEDFEELFDIMERATVIYISRARNTVMLDSNNFQRNIGLFGGAITINALDLSAPNKPVVAFKNNYFEHNMAYLSGNSIYVRLFKDFDGGFCGGVLSVQNYHYQQAGLKIHNGGAATFICQTIPSAHSDIQTVANIISTFKLEYDFQKEITRVKLEDTDQSLTVIDKMSSLVFDSDQYEDCNSGQRGSALSIRNFSNIQISNSIFTLNGPVYAPYIETQYSPYYLHFAENLVLFNDTECKDEFDYLERCTIKYPNRPDILFSRTQGALYVEFCMTVTCQSRFMSLDIKGSFFTTNDAGSLLDRQYDNFEYKTASCIYVFGGNTVKIWQSTFSQNQGRFLSQYFPTIYSTSKLSAEYFPPQYFYHAHSPIINWFAYRGKRININEKASNQYSFFISNCIFSQNKNMQTFKLPGELHRQKYYGQLLSVRNQENNMNSIQTEVTIQNCSVSENFFAGNESSLVYVENAILSIIRSTFVNNGLIMDNWIQGSKRRVMGEQGFVIDVPNLQNQSLGVDYLPQQQHGIFYLNNSQQVRSNLVTRVFKFVNNKINFLFSQYGVGTIYAMQHDAIFQNNMYSHIFSMGKGALLLFNSTADQYTTIMFSNETYYNMYSNDGGLLNLQSMVQKAIFTILFLDCNFKNVKTNTQSPLTFESNTRKVIMNNTNFTSDAIFMQPAQIQSKFTRLKYMFTQFVNATLFKDIVSDMTHENGLIHVQDRDPSAYWPTKFENNTLEQVKDIDNNWASVILNACNFENITSYMIKNMVIFFEPQNPDYLSMNNIRIYNMFVLQSAMIGMGDNTQLIGNNIFFQLCTTYFKTAGIMAGTKSKINLQNVVFKNLTALTASSVFMMPNSILECSQCSFVGNFANDSGVIQTSLESKVRFSNSQFIQNLGSNTLMTFIYTTTLFRNVTFIDNKSPGVSSIAIQYGGDAFVESILVANSGKILPQIIPLNGFIVGQMMAKIIINNSNFTKLSATKSAILNLDGLSKAVIKNCTIFANQGQTLINAENAQYLQIDQSVFSQNKAVNEIYVESTALYVYNTIFYFGQGRYVNALKSMVDVKNSVFYDGDPIIGSGKGLLATNVDTLTVVQCRFNRLNSSENGGALSIITNEILTTQSQIISKNEFTDNSAFKGQGGAVSIDSSLDISLNSNKFYNNKAIRGGALYFQCPLYKKNDPRSCKFFVNQTNNFTGNSATIQGGAIQWDNIMPVLDNTNIMRDNMASYNPKMASSPKGVWLEFISNNDYFDSYNIQSFLRTQTVFPMVGERIEIFGQIPTVVSGIPFQLLIFVTDQDDSLYQPVLEGFRAKLRLQGRPVNTSIVNNYADFDRGIFNFTNTIILAPPGTAVPLYLEFQGYSGVVHLFSGLKQDLVFSVRQCVDGEELTNDLKCKTCPDGSYLKNYNLTGTSKQQRGGTCQKCPSYAVCLGGKMIVPASGYFRTYTDNDTIQQCPNSKACLGGDQKNVMGICAFGYQGNMCIECQDGYYQSGNFKCNKCPLKYEIKRRIFAALILGCLLLIVISFASLDTGSQIKPVIQSMIKLIVNHFHQIMILGIVDYNWSQLVQKFQQSYIDLASSSDYLFQLQCLFNSQASSNGYYQNMILYLCAFPVLSLIAFIIYAIISSIKRIFLSQIHRLISVIIIVVYMTHPIITIGAFESLSCANVGGEHRLRAYARALCFQGDHMKYTLNYTSPTIVLWIIGTPLLILYLNFRKGKLLEKIEIPDLEEVVFEQILEHKNRYGFIIAGFQLRSLYWEFLIMLRKSLMILFVIFLSNFSSELSSIALLIILTLSLLLHHRYQPYHTPFLNTLESSSLSIQLVFVYMGLIFQQSADTTATDISKNNDMMMKSQLSNFFFVVLLMSNVHFYALWLYNFRLELIKLMSTIYHPIDQSSMIRRALFTVVAFRTPKQYLENFKNETQQSEMPTVLFYKCVPKIVDKNVASQDQSSIYKKKKVNSSQQHQQDPITVDDVLIEGNSSTSLKERSSQTSSIQQKKNSSHRMIKAKIREKQINTAQKMMGQLDQSSFEQKSPPSASRLNEELKNEDNFESNIQHHNKQGFNSQIQPKLQEQYKGLRN